jgi:hypothetical protein
MSEPNSDKDPASTPDELVSSGITATDQLTDKGIEGVSGGGGITVNKAKTADKAYTQMDGYIKQ